MPSRKSSSRVEKNGRRLSKTDLKFLIPREENPRLSMFKIKQS